MRSVIAAISFVIAAAVPLAAQDPGAAGGDAEIARAVYEDAKVIRRVVEISRSDMPRDLIRSILDEDLQLLRAPIADHLYRYAGYQRTESGRSDQRFSFETPKDSDEADQITFSDEMVYRLRLQVPSRRYLVLSNRRAWIDSVDISYVPVGAATSRVHTVDVSSWLEPGDERQIELPEIAGKASAAVRARTDRGEKAFVDLTFYRASLVDDPDSPFATVVRRIKTLDDAVRGREYRQVRNVADEVLALLESRAMQGDRPVISAIPTSVSPAAGASDDLYFELRHIEDLLTGSEEERSEGIERLRRVTARLRPQM